MKETIDRNPYHLCTLDPNSDCETCGNNKVLDCKLDRRQTVVTTLVIYSFIVVSVVGLYLVGSVTQAWWVLIVFVVFVPLFFVVIEPRITCSHCPYYAEQRLRFNCPGNMLTPKLWKYHPEPMNKYEQLGTLIGFIFFGAFPIFVELYGIWVLLAEDLNIMDAPLLELLVIMVATIILISMLYAVFLFVFCKKCVNFSCQFNQVPKSVADRYIKANPVMREAWEKSGYKF
jgi:small-conductance mechanosensitive channel